jgi:hypothetical protein
MDLILGLVIGLLIGVILGLVLARFLNKPTAVDRPLSPATAAASPNASVLDQILGGDEAPKAPTEAERIHSLRQNLRVKFLHDDAKVEEAINREREREPNGTMLQWLEGAVYRWERENR